MNLELLNKWVALSVLAWCLLRRVRGGEAKVHPEGVGWMGWMVGVLSAGHLTKDKVQWVNALFSLTLP